MILARNMEKITNFEKMYILFLSKKEKCIGNYCDIYYDDIKFQGCRYNEIYSKKVTSEYIIEPVRSGDNCFHYNYQKELKKKLRNDFEKSLICKILPCPKSQKILKKTINE